MKTIYMSVLLMLLGITAGQAENGVLAFHVPGGADPAIVLAVVKQSLTNRSWTVGASDEKSVEATLVHSGNDAKLRITLSNGQLVYEGTSTYSITAGPAGQQKLHRTQAVPKRWIANLRRDITAILATMPESRR